MIDPQEAKSVIEIERFCVNGNDWVLYYIDNEEDCNIQISPDFDGHTNAHVTVWGRYMKAEGLDDLVHKFIRSSVTQRWLRNRRTGKFKPNPRPSTVKKLIDNWNKFKNKYTTIQIS